MSSVNQCASLANLSRTCSWNTPLGAMPSGGMIAISAFGKVSRLIPDPLTIRAFLYLDLGARNSVSRHVGGWPSMAFSRHPFIASKPRRAHHGVRVRLPGQRCWYGSLLTHSVRRGVFFAVWRPVLDSRDTDSIPQGLTPPP